MPIPLPRSAFVGGKRATVDRSFRVALVPAELHDDVFAVDGLAAEKFTEVAIERAYLAIVEFQGLAVGPVDRPQASLRIEQSHRETFEWTARELRMENVVVGRSQQDR